MTFVPSLNWPRFFRSSTRSKRFRTFRFAVIVLAPFRLRCCDINTPFLREIESGHPTTMLKLFNPVFWSLFAVRKVGVRSRRRAQDNGLRKMLGEELENTFLGRFADPTLGDKACNQLAGRNIETVVRNRAV